MSYESHSLPPEPYDDASSSSSQSSSAGAAFSLVRFGLACAGLVKGAGFANEAGFAVGVGFAGGTGRLVAEGSEILLARRGCGSADAVSDEASSVAYEDPPGMSTTVLHFGQRTFLPAAVLGTDILLPHSEQGITILSDIVNLTQRLENV